MRVKQIFLSILVFSLISACGRRTAPVPFEVPDLRLPEISFSSISYRGDQLVIEWQLKDNKNPDKTIKIKHFKLFFLEQVNCGTCNADSGWEVTLSNGKLKPTDKRDTKTEDRIRFIHHRDRYFASITRRGLKQKALGDIFKIGINLTTENQLVSKTVYSGVITEAPIVPMPEIVKAKVIKETGSETSQILIQWQNKQETALQVLSLKGGIQEKSLLYGINLYQYENTKEALYAKPLNHKVLKSDQILVEINQKNLYICFVDRLGNESKRVQIVPE